LAEPDEPGRLQQDAAMMPSHGSQRGKVPAAPAARPAASAKLPRASQVLAKSNMLRSRA
jgi:hypothetical protein